jgi:hypothetical protein
MKFTGSNRKMDIEEFKTTRQKLKAATHHKKSMKSDQTTRQSKFVCFYCSNLWICGNTPQVYLRPFQGPAQRQSPVSPTNHRPAYSDQSWRSSDQSRMTHQPSGSDKRRSRGSVKAVYDAKSGDGPHTPTQARRLHLSA